MNDSELNIDDILQKVDEDEERTRLADKRSFTHTGVLRFSDNCSTKVTITCKNVELENKINSLVESFFERSEYAQYKTATLVLDDGKPIHFKRKSVSIEEGDYSELDSHQKVIIDASRGVYG